MSFNGARVVAFESRRAVEIAELIRRSGGEPFVAPSLLEAPLAENKAAFAFADRLYAGEFDMVILLTGVGTRFLADVLATREPVERFRDALRKVTTVARGPKPSAVLREWAVPVGVIAPEPNTWREVLQAVAGRPERSVAVQEYGRTNEELLAGLRAQGREVTSVPVYQWQLPEDTSALRDSITGLLERQYEAAVFTTGVQIDHLLALARQSGREESVITALRNIFVASIGPDTTEALRSYGIEPSFVPTHPKMGVLIQEASRAYGGA